jgi:cytochrome c-type biogenesis protein CcmH/NrfG
MLGRCYAAAGKPDKAVECYLQALQADPKHPLAKGLLAAAEKQDAQTPRP